VITINQIWGTPRVGARTQGLDQMIAVIIAQFFFFFFFFC